MVAKSEPKTPDDEAQDKADSGVVKLEPQDLQDWQEEIQSVEAEIEAEEAHKQKVWRTKRNWNEYLGNRKPDKKRRHS